MVNSEMVNGRQMRVAQKRVSAADASSIHHSPLTIHRTEGALL
jgi:hypothetical protein